MYKTIELRIPLPPPQSKKRPITFIPGDSALFYAHYCQILFPRNHLLNLYPRLGFSLIY